MVEYTKVNVKLSNTQIKKLKDAIKIIQKQLQEWV